MKFKIDLRPYPGAPYFTIVEHQRRYNEEIENLSENIHISESLLRKLFSIPSELRFELFELAKKEQLLRQFGSVVRKDDPDTGMDNLRDGSPQAKRSLLLDLSFSFPQVPKKASDVDMIMIDPNASLGIPAEFFIAFRQDDAPIMDMFRKDLNDLSAPRGMYLLKEVLKDYEERGRETLLRESSYKAAVLHQMIENSSYLHPMTSRTTRSQTMIVAECEPQLLEQITNMGYIVSIQERNLTTVLTIANYPTHSKELIEMICDKVAAM